MSDNPVDMRDGAAVGAASLFARAATAAAESRRLLGGAIDDFFLDEDARFDERTRAALTGALRGLVEAVEAELRAHAGLPAGDSAYGRLVAAGLLRDPELMAEMIARVRQELIAAALPAQALEDAERLSLINRWLAGGDRAVASGAMDVMVAESRRRGVEPGPAGTELPAELHHRLAWRVAAALRAETGEVMDRVLSEAAFRSLAAHDEAQALEAAAMRLAVAADVPQADVPRLLLEALADRRLALFTALLAHAIGVAYGDAREITLDPAGDRLWLALRALGAPRECVAQIGYALSVADPRRDLEAFADAIEAIMAVDPRSAHQALAPLRLNPDYRAAILALAGGGA